MVSTQIEYLSMDDDRRKKWSAFCKRLIKSLQLDTGLLMEKLEPEQLEELAIVTSAASFNKKMIRMNTGLLYKQQKYNLVWEENEGYSRLVIDMTTAALSEVSVEDALKVVYSIIGYFDLDPNRVLDIVLDCFEQLLNYKTYFVAFLKALNFKRSTMNDILGFKFSTYYRDNTLLATPKSLFSMAAILIESKLVALTDLYNHVTIRRLYICICRLYYLLANVAEAVR
jgi:THO complex subunit 2